MSPRLLRLALGVVTGLLATLAYLGTRGPGPAPTEPGPVDPFLTSPVPAPPLTLFDPRGDTVRLSDHRGRVVALFFGYTHCPDVCPITLAQLARLQSELDPDGERLQVVFVSLDPARDTADALARYVEALLPSAVAATAPVEDLRPQVLRYGIGFVYRPRGGGPADSLGPPPGPEGAAPADDYLVDHTARTFLIDREGRLVAQVLPETRSDVLREALLRVLEGP